MLKKSILAMALLLSFSAGVFAASNDTIAVDQKEITEWIKEPYITSSGKESFKYYAVWNGQLLTTSKSVFEKQELCTKHGIRLALIAIGKYTTICKGKVCRREFLAKRIALN